MNRQGRLSIRWQQGLVKSRGHVEHVAHGRAIAWQESSIGSSTSRRRRGWASKFRRRCVPLNARRCGRTHCRYTGPYYLAMNAAGATGDQDLLVVRAVIRHSRAQPPLAVIKIVISLEAERPPPARRRNHFRLRVLHGRRCGAAFRPKQWVPLRRSPQHAIGVSRESDAEFVYRRLAATTDVQS